MKFHQLAVVGTHQSTGPCLTKNPGLKSVLVVRFGDPKDIIFSQQDIFRESKELAHLGELQGLSCLNGRHLRKLGMARILYAGVDH